MTLAFEPQPPVLAPVEGGIGFPVRRLFCVGRNYAAHAREMGQDPDREPPFFFSAWAETVVTGDAVIAYPHSRRHDPSRCRPRWIMSTAMRPAST